MVGNSNRTELPERRNLVIIEARCAGQTRNKHDWQSICIAHYWVHKSTN
jgi:hypothetical protein